MATPDFMRLNGEAVRITSLTRDPDGEHITAVVMLRGLRDHERLIDLLGQPAVTVELPGEAARAMTVSRHEFSSSGEGPRALFRHVIALRDVEGMPEEAESLERRLARIEEKLDRVLDLIAHDRAGEASVSARH